INTHTHAAMTIFRGLAEDMPLHTWLNDYIFPIEAAHINAESVRVGSELAIMEMLRSGTTTFNDMYFFEGVTAEVAKKMKIRAILSEGVLGFPTPNAPTAAYALDYTKELFQEYKDHSHIQIAFNAHAPYTCSPTLLQQTKEMSRRYGTIWSIHLAETQWEFDKYTNEHNCTPTAYLNKLGVLDKRSLVAHAVHLSAPDIEVLRLADSAVAHNPECNMKLASGVAPIEALRKAGVKIGIGTDGAASNNNLDLLQEVRTAALLQKLTTQNTEAAPAAKMIQMLTLGGAKALGIDSFTGSLELGKKADIITIDLQQAHNTPMFNPYANLLYSVHSQDVRNVMVNGFWVLKDLSFTQLDTNSILENAKNLAKILSKFKRIN
ncbi:MAG: hypothetical protein RIS47_1534, partial [Bacteroidota bacterium]